MLSHFVDCTKRGKGVVARWLSESDGIRKCQPQLLDDGKDEDDNDYDDEDKVQKGRYESWEI